jgi:hypothetical protein
MGRGKGLRGVAGGANGDHNPNIIDDWASGCQVKYVTNFLPVGKNILVDRMLAVKTDNVSADETLAVGPNGVRPSFPVQHHPGAQGATPPHLRRGAFEDSPPDSGGVARLAPGWLPARGAQHWPEDKNVDTPGREQRSASPSESAAHVAPGFSPAPLAPVERYSVPASVSCGRPSSSEPAGVW